MSNNETPANAADMSRNRHGSFSSTFSNLFPRSNSVSNGTPVFPGPITSAAMNDQNRRRRLSLSTAAAMGLSGSSPVSAGGSGSGSGPSLFGVRRSSMSTNSSVSDAAVDESAIEEDDGAPSGTRISPRNTPFARRTSFGAQAMRTLRGPGGGSVGASPNGRQRSSFAASPSGGRGQHISSPRSPSSPFPPPSPVLPSVPNFGLAAALYSPRAASDKFYVPTARADQGYNWPEQFRSRAESSVVSGSRPSFSFASGMSNSPPRAGGPFPMHGFSSVGGGVGVGAVQHERSRSVPDVPTPVASAAPPPPRQRRPSRPKPDQFQERILKGDFYMD